MMAKMIMIMKGYTEMNSIIITENACRHAEKVRDKHAYILALQTISPFLNESPASYLGAYERIMEVGVCFEKNIYVPSCPLSVFFLTYAPQLFLNKRKPICAFNIDKELATGAKFKDGKTGVSNTNYKDQQQLRSNSSQDNIITSRPKLFCR